MCSIPSMTPSSIERRQNQFLSKKHFSKIFSSLEILLHQGKMAYYKHLNNSSTTIVIFEKKNKKK